MVGKLIENWPLVHVTYIAEKDMNNELISHLTGEYEQKRNNAVKLPEKYQIVP